MASKKKKSPTTSNAPSSAASNAPSITREYEVIYIMRSGVDPDSAQDIGGRVQALVDGSGKMLRVDNWGRRRLAYPIAGSSRGVYVCLRFISGPEVVAEIERQLKLSDDVVRYQTVLIARDVKASDYEVKPEDVAFAPVEPAPEDDEPGFAQRLGLVEPPPRPKPPEPSETAAGAAEGAAAAGSPAEAGAASGADGEAAGAASTEDEAAAGAEAAAEGSQQERAGQ